MSRKVESGLHVFDFSNSQQFIRPPSSTEALLDGSSRCFRQLREREQEAKFGVLKVDQVLFNKNDFPEVHLMSIML